MSCLQHWGYVIPPQADAGWLGEPGPDTSYLAPGSGGPRNDLTDRNRISVTGNLLHLARMIKDAGVFQPTVVSDHLGSLVADLTSRIQNIVEWIQVSLRIYRNLNNHSGVARRSGRGITVLV